MSSWRCRLGWHTWQIVVDRTLTIGGPLWVVCTRCGVVRAEDR